GGGSLGTACGVELDSTFSATFIGGSIESTGTPMRISSKPGRATQGVANLVIQNVDFENPGDGNSYIEIGKNWDGSLRRALVGAKITIQGSLSGTTDVPYALYAEHTTDLHIEQMLAAMSAGTAVGRFYLAGSAHAGLVIEPHAEYYDDG